VAKQVVLTKEGYEELKQRLDHLTTERRREIAEAIKQAREFGDLSENAEYDAAKNEQALLEDEIQGLEEQLRDAVIVEKGDQPRGEVAIGSTVTLKGPRGKELKFKVVGSAEADPDQNRLSNESPIGRAVMGRKKGDKVEVSTPKGVVKYEIATISRA
jgi:transcription elongation factor GreA